MKTVYLVKKNPEMPAGKDNWIIMNGKDFASFMKTSEGKRRKADFGKLDGCDINDVIIIAECGKEKAVQWRSEKDHHDYLDEAKKETGYTSFSYHAISSENGDVLSGEELIADIEANVEETAINRMMIEKLRSAVMSLNAQDRFLVEKMFLCADPMTQKEFAELTGKGDRSTIHYQIRRVLDKLRLLMQQ